MESPDAREPISDDALLLDLLSAAGANAGSGAILSQETTDLDLNLVRFAGGAGVGSHVNREVDVVVVAVAGEGTVEVAGVSHRLRPGQAIVIPKGLARSITSQPAGEFVYLTVHRRRRPLMPSPLAPQVDPRPRA